VTNEAPAAEAPAPEAPTAAPKKGQMQESLKKAIMNMVNKKEASETERLAAELKKQASAHDGLEERLRSLENNVKALWNDCDKTESTVHQQAKTIQTDLAKVERIIDAFKKEVQDQNKDDAIFNREIEGILANNNK
jgi:predicted RNase H-like nuclease (RuvC/YqgF family)